MVFVSKNLVRKCKYCDKEPKKNLTSGRNKGYYTTCGSKECLSFQYQDHRVCARKGRPVNPKDYICLLCNQKFEGKSPRHKRYCKECVPDNSWRGRADRYLIGKKQWDLMLFKQNNTCALCNKIPEVVDHCHTKGVVRGLLCNGCNVKLKILDMDIEYLKRAIQYTGGNYSIQK